MGTSETWFMKLTLPDMDDMGFLENLELIRKSAEGVRLTVGGMLFVGKQKALKQYLPQAEVIYLHYSDTKLCEDGILYKEGRGRGTKYFLCK